MVPCRTHHDFVIGINLSVKTLITCSVEAHVSDGDCNKAGNGTCIKSLHNTCMLHILLLPCQWKYWHRAKNRLRDKTGFGM